jgi:hypothetical protein
MPEHDILAKSRRQAQESFIQKPQQDVSKQRGLDEGAAQKVSEKFWCVTHHTPHNTAQCVHVRFRQRHISSGVVDYLLSRCLLLA